MPGRTVTVSVALRSTHTLEFILHCTFFQQLLDVLGPLLAEHVGACERAVTADDDHRVDAALDQVGRREVPALERAELFRARRANDRAALV